MPTDPILVFWWKYDCELPKYSILDVYLMFAFTCILYFAGALFRFFQAKQEKLNPFHSQPIGSPQSY